MKISSKRLLAAVLAFVLVLSLFPVTQPMHVHAATALTTSVEGLTASWEYTATNKNGSCVASGNAITVTATGGMLNRTTIKLTLTNSLSEEATLKFTYSKSGGTLSGAVSSTSGTYEKVLASGASVTVSFQSGRSQTNTLSITEISLISASAADPNLTFMAPVNGSYTINGAAVTAETKMTVSAGSDLALVATPASGYQFYGWKNEKGVFVSQNANYTLTAAVDTTITPVFISSSVALFGVGAMKYDNLSDAAAAAVAGTNKVIVLLNNGTVSGNHTIPAGVTLLIPYNDDNTRHGANASCTSYSSYFNGDGNIAWVKPTAYRTLTLASDASITVNGNIEVGGRHAAAGGKSGMYGGSPTEKLGFVNMLSGSHIELNSGANLYCWGYIYGEGTITAKNGASIYENFQIMDFRGGSVTSQLASEFLVFPLSQYYVQNIEVATRYEYGSTEYIATSIFMSNMCHSATVKFIGAGAMFQPTPGSYFIKDYNPATDMLEMHAYGDSVMASMNLELGGTAIDSSTFVLPITNNISINLHSGTTTLKQNMMLLPGSSLTIGKDATLNLAFTEETSDVVTAGGHVLQVFDSENWLKALNMDTLETVAGMNFVHPARQFRPLAYTCTSRKTRTVADLTDVTIDINGKIIADGFIYSTVTWADAPNEDLTIVSGGANIISSEKTGMLVMNNGAGQDMLGYMFDQSKASYYFIPLASVQLKNGDGTLLDTTGAEPGATFNYCATHNKWVKQVNVSFNANGGNGSMDDQVLELPCCEKLNSNLFTKNNATFGAWNTAADGTGVAYADGIVTNATEDLVLFAQWNEIKTTYEVTWIVDGVVNTVEVNQGEIPIYNGGANPFKPADGCTVYTFTGWQDAAGNTYAAGVSLPVGENTYIALFASNTIHSYDYDCSKNCKVCGVETRPEAECVSNSAYACVDGNCVYCGGNVPATAGHNWEAPDCENDGYCLDCGAAGEGSTGHGANGYTYQSNYENTHNVFCADCCEPVGIDRCEFDENHECVKCHAIERMIVTFLHDGLLWTETYVEYNTKLGIAGMPVPDAPVGHQFGGWYTADGVKVVHGMTITEDVVARSTFKPITWTLTVALPNGDAVELDAPYGAKLLEILNRAVEEDLIPAAGQFIRANNEYVNGEYYISGSYIFDDYTTFVDENSLMPNANCLLIMSHEFSGWSIVDTDGDFVYDSWQYCDPDNGMVGEGWHYIEEDYDDEPGGAWYFFEHKGWSDVRVEGISRVPYPTEPINGITYGPNPDDLAYAQANGLAFIDAETSLFVFGEDGKFQQFTGAIRNEDNSVVLHYAINGQLPWHIGLVQVGSHVYYFVGENVKAVGDVYVTRFYNVSGAVMGGIYTFGADGNLCRYDGITEVNGVLRYYEHFRLMAGNGLTKVGDEFIYIRSNGELVVNAKYYVPANDLGIVPGEYAFDENGYMVNPVSTDKDGIYFENGAWYYYENGVIGYNKGLVNTLKTWYDADGNAFWGEGGIIYVRSNGQLATGKYYVTNLSNYDQTIAVAVGAPLQFNEYGLMGSVKNGIVDGYYYENNQIVYSAGLIQIDGNYYYVRSNGQVVMGRDYWISNANDTGIKLGCYTFDENGVMQIPETYGFTGIKNGYYYIDGSVAYGAGVVKLDDGTYIYVRSNGQLAVGKYWPTTLNGYLPAGEYDFGEDGILTVE